MKVIEHHEENFSRLLLDGEQERVVFAFDKQQKRLNIIASRDVEECEVALSAEKINAMLGFFEQAFKE